MLKRLNLGSGRLEKLDPGRLEKFLTKDWVNLGDGELRNPNGKPLQAVDYSKTTFIPFFYKSGGTLPFEERGLSFIFSEHFLEHLYLKEAKSLLGECNRVLIDGGIIRVVVPDADLRPIPEKIGFPSDSMSYDRPEKHKIRWSVYLLGHALEEAGFRINPIKYYDSNRVLHDKSGNLDLSFYDGCPEIALVKDFSIIKRLNSLIVDGVKWD